MLTVLLATRNRAPALGGVLEAYCELRAPRDGWRVVVVDNGSEDATGEVLASFAGRLPIVALHEPRPGKNAALNTGLQQAQGDLIVLTDDDAFPRADWLCRLQQAADEHPEVSVFGGTVLPRWEEEPPTWALEWVPRGPTFTLTDPGVQDGPTAAHNVFGPNMAVRATVFQHGARFDETIGPTHRPYAMGSETEFVRRLLESGHQAWFVRDAVVEHLIREEQLTPSWVFERAVRFGRGQFRLARRAAGPTAGSRLWFGVPRYLLRLAAQQSAAYAWATLLRRREAAFRARWELKFLQGSILEARLAHRL